MGSAHPLNAPYQALRTSDGWVNVGAANQANWLRLIEVLEAPELAEDERFKENSGRMAHLAELSEALEEHMVSRTTDEWLATFEEAGLPAGPVLDIAEMHRDPQAIAREMVVEADHARLGPVKTIGLPIKFSDTPGGVATGAPLYGQHTREVLSEYGYNADEIEALAECGAVVTEENA
jgi:crotonobetainyl-CoA:carnitine CoA-transferase CaiB-like acyl-CoA transferase